MRKLLIALVVVIVVLVALDFGARAYAGSRAEEAIAQELGGQADVDVSIEGFPFLLDAVRGVYPEVVVNAQPSGATRPLIANARAVAELTNVTLPLSDALSGDTSNLAAQSTVVRAYLPLAALPAALDRPELTFSAGAGGGVTVSATASVAGRSIPLTGTANISISDNSLTVAVTDLSAADIQLSPAARAAIDSRFGGLRASVPLVGLPFSITDGDVSVQGDSVVVTVTTGPVMFSQLR